MTRTRTEPVFVAATIDDAPGLLEQSYRLRYQVYCVERNFLPKADYPHRLEVDEFDRGAVHVGVVDASGELAATARVVSTGHSGGDLPLLRRCRIFPNTRELLDPLNHVVEISRLAMSRGYGVPAFQVRERRSVRRDVFLALLKAIYQATKRIHATHWIAATEASLQRLVAHYEFPFRVVGPQCDYGGPVAPYLMNLAEFDRVITSGRIPALNSFLVGLEPQFSPLAVRTSADGISRIGRAPRGGSPRHVGGV